MRVRLDTQTLCVSVGLSAALVQPEGRSNSSLCPPVGCDGSLDGKDADRVGIGGDNRDV